jgi:hypothetical protein
MDAQVMVHPLMKKALQSRQAAISQRQEIRQINNSKRRISSARQATAMWDKAMDLEAQAIKSILDRYALCGFVHFREDQRYSCNGMGLFDLSSSNRHFLMKGKCIIWWFHNSIQNILLEFLTTEVKTVKHVLDAGAMLGKRSQATFLCS